MLYQYQQLNKRQIRLLDLDPGHSTAPLSCAIRHAFLDDGPEYEALSYTGVIQVYVIQFLVEQTPSTSLKT